MAPQNSMLTAAMAEVFLNLAGFETERFVEHRLKGLNVTCDITMLDKALGLLRSPLVAIEILLFGPKLLVETDWFSLAERCPPDMLPELTKERFLEEFRNSKLNLYFGWGNETHIILSNGTIAASEINPRFATVFIDEHPLSAYLSLIHI